METHAWWHARISVQYSAAVTKVVVLCTCRGIVGNVEGAARGGLMWRLDLVGGAGGGALDVRQSEDAGLAADEQGAGELGVEAQQGGARPEGHAVHQARSRSQVKHLPCHCLSTLTVCLISRLAVVHA